jgi:hypothetical protein
MGAEFSENRLFSEHARFLLLLRHFRIALSRKGGESMTIFDGGCEFIRVAGGFLHHYRELPNVLTHEEYKEVAKPFVASFERLRFLFEMPIQLIYQAGMSMFVSCIARYRCGINPQDDSRDGETQVRQAMVTAVAEIVANYDSEKSFNVGSTMLDRFIEVPQTPNPARESIEAVQAALVMSAYAAFETLAADLWITAVNRHHQLARNWLEKNQERQLSGNVIAGYGFNLERVMGTILRDTKKVTFESLDDIRKIYKDSLKIDIDGVFDPVDDLIKAEKTRHLFAHRGGLIDQKFKTQMSRYPEYTNVAIGERLRLTGPVTASHVGACCKSGIALLKEVDNWSTAHT